MRRIRAEEVASPDIILIGKVSGITSTIIKGRQKEIQIARVEATIWSWFMQQSG